MIENIFAIGFHHQSLSSTERGEILLQNESTQEHFYQSQLEQYGVKAATLLKTCNRMELYGYGDIAGAEKLFFSLFPESASFQGRHSVKVGAEGMHHIFKVASGLDSQLLGDQEIVSQFKQSFQASKSQNLLDGFMERLANTCLQASKQIRKKTKLTQGTTSLSYAAIQILKQLSLPCNSSVLIVGLGKFGTSIAKNIDAYFPALQLTVANRTISKSLDLAERISCEVLALELVKEQISNFDVVISAIEMREYLWSARNYEESPSQIIIDLSVPSPIHPDVQQVTGIRYYSIEEATQIVNETWKEREASIAPALEIIDEFKNEFISWSKTYSHSGVIQEWKSKLEETAEICPFFSTMEETEKSYYMQKSMGLFVKFLKEETSVVPDGNLIHAYLKNG